MSSAPSREIVCPQTLSETASWGQAKVCCAAVLLWRLQAMLPQDRSRLLQLQQEHGLRQGLNMACAQSALPLARSVRQDFELCAVAVLLRHSQAVLPQDRSRLLQLQHRL